MDRDEESRHWIHLSWKSGILSEPLTLQCLLPVYHSESLSVRHHVEIWETDFSFSKILMKVVGQQAQTHTPEKDQEGEVAIGRE